MQKAEPERGTSVEAELAHALAKPEEAAFDETGVKRVLSGWAARAVATIALCFSAYQLVIAAYAVPATVEYRQVAFSSVVSDNVACVVPAGSIPEGPPLPGTGGVVSWGLLSRAMSPPVRARL